MPKPRSPRQSPPNRPTPTCVARLPSSKQKSRPSRKAARPASATRLASSTPAKTSLAKANDALAAKPAAPAYPNLTGRVAELEAALLLAQSAKPAYPDLSGKVTELTGTVDKLTQENSRLTALASEATSAKQEAAALLAAKEAATKAGPGYPDLRRTTSQASSPNSPPPSRRSPPWKPAAPAYPDLSGKVAELSSALAAKPAAPAYPDYSGRVKELEGVLADTERKLAATTATQSSLNQQVAALTKEKTKPLPPRRAPADLFRARWLSSRLPSPPPRKSRRPANRPVLPSRSSSTTTSARPPPPSANRLPCRPTSNSWNPTRPRCAVRPRPRPPKPRSCAPKLPRSRNRSPRSPPAPRLSRPLRPGRRSRRTSSQQPSRPSRFYPDLSAKVTDLEKQLATAKTAAPAYPDYSARVKELEGVLADADRKVAAADPPQHKPFPHPDPFRAPLSPASTRPISPTSPDKVARRKTAPRRTRLPRPLSPRAKGLQDLEALQLARRRQIRQTGLPGSFQQRGRPREPARGGQVGQARLSRPLWPSDEFGEATRRRQIRDACVSRLLRPREGTRRRPRENARPARSPPPPHKPFIHRPERHCRQPPDRSRRRPQVARGKTRRTRLPRPLRQGAGSRSPVGPTCRIRTSQPTRSLQ